MLELKMGLRANINLKQLQQELPGGIPPFVNNESRLKDGVSVIRVSSKKMWSTGSLILVESHDRQGNPDFRRLGQLMNFYAYHATPGLRNSMLSLHCDESGLRFLDPSWNLWIRGHWGASEPKFKISALERNVGTVQVRGGELLLNARARCPQVLRQVLLNVFGAVMYGS